MACAIDSEGSIQVTTRASKNMPTRAHSLRVMIYNSDKSYVDQVCNILTSWDIQFVDKSRMTSKVGTLEVTSVIVQRMQSVKILLDKVIPYMTSKRGAAEAMLALAENRIVHLGRHKRAPWTAHQLRLVEQFRRDFMPKSFANGETLPSESSRAIPCQAEGSVKSTSEGVETRGKSTASNNFLHECPAAFDKVEDIVRSSEKSEKTDDQKSTDQ